MPRMFGVGSCAGFSLATPPNEASCCHARCCKWNFVWQQSYAAQGRKHMSVPIFATQHAFVCFFKKIPKVYRSLRHRLSATCRNAKTSSLASSSSDEVSDRWFHCLFQESLQLCILRAMMLWSHDDFSIFMKLIALTQKISSASKNTMFFSFLRRKGC